MDLTWPPGKEAEPGVEPPEWLGELGRDLQASSAACFFWATIFWTAGDGRIKDTGGGSVNHPHYRRTYHKRLYAL